MARFHCAWWRERKNAIKTTAATEMTRHKPQLQLGALDSALVLNSIFCAMVIIEGSAIRVITPDRAMIAQRKTPTVL